MALQLAAEKRAAIVMADGAFAELAQTAVPGFAAGWEIPVSVGQSSRCVLFPSMGALVAGWIRLHVSYIGASDAGSQCWRTP